MVEARAEKELIVAAKVTVIPAAGGSRQRMEG